MEDRNTKIFDKIWKAAIFDKSPQAGRPVGIVLGGQPGAGKSNLAKYFSLQFEGNIIVINGDEYRKYHPDYTLFQTQGVEKSSDKTQSFSNGMVEALLTKAITEKYNLIIEGTFRTSGVPIETLRMLKGSGYHTIVAIQTCSSKLSWHSCLERYGEALKSNPEEARYTIQENHDFVCSSLAVNINDVCQKGFPDELQIFKRELVDGKNIIECIFNGKPSCFQEDIVNSVLLSGFNPPNNKNVSGPDCGESKQQKFPPFDE